MRRWLPTWVVVGLGLLLNIVSALMTNFYIDDATQQANTLVQQQQNNDKLISVVWQQVETLERKREHIMTMLTVSDGAGDVIPAPVEAQLIKGLSDWIAQPPSRLRLATLPDVMTQLDTAQRTLRDKVDQLYLDNLRLVEIHGSKMEAISRMRNLALFLQVIGLAMVLARDLNRRDYAYASVSKKR
ncbi:hypothetical protein GCM10007086_23780 [Photobacterium aphoticum]|uniref:DNA mismatch repair protein n=2 Tax=Photobacterium aphoticum TaxID=754436 RepID=A0A0J1GNG9_9GAMM|nr:hypothetical protein ABT58_08400 [Photobacterium aphoticum]PSU55451.1 hypothetical protein C9I90_16320 [Photobacterium aphoticum]GHA49269.1 hypothetical protein GCM10007086_23780 [Photobacterium aphoticum]